MTDKDQRRKLTSWLRSQLPGAEDVHIDELDRVAFGHSAETLLLTVGWNEGGAARRQEVVLRLRPPTPGLLEPYDLKRQFDILRALEPTPVRSPAALWYEGSGDVLGREFYVMERLPGSVYERVVPTELQDDPERVRRMARDMTEQIAAIHTVDLDATGLRALEDGGNHARRDLDHWDERIRHFQRGPLPALERLLAELRARQPTAPTTVTLVHGDAKPGNFAFVGDVLTAVFDWELAGIGDPLTDIGWAEVLWSMPGSFTTVPGSPGADEFIDWYEELTGIEVTYRDWYRAHQLFKMAAINLVGSMLFDRGHTDDPRLAQMGYAVPFLTTLGLAELGIEEELESGPVLPRPERRAADRP